MTPPLVLPEPPSTNRWVRFWRGKALLSRAAREYKERAYMLALLFAKMARIKKPADVAVELTWFRGRRSGDLDNRLKIVLDTLSGVLYEDDSQIAEIHAYRIDRPGNPGVEVRVTELTHVPTQTKTTARKPIFLNSKFNTETR